MRLQRRKTETAQAGPSDGVLATMRALVTWLPSLPFRGPDPDFILITDYLAGHMPAHEAVAFEQRLEDDGEFFEKAWPLMRISAVGPELRERHGFDAGAVMRETGLAPRLSDADLEDAYHNIREELGLPPGSFEQFKAQRAEMEKDSDGALAPISFAEYKEGKKEAERQRMVARVKLAAAILLLLAPLDVARLIVENRMQAAREYHETIERRASTAYLGTLPSRTTTKPHETEAVVLENGAVVILGSESRITHQGDNAALDGHAVVLIAGPAGHLLLNTSTGRVVLTPGRYSIDAPTGSEPMVVRVDSGEAHVYGREDKGPGVVLRDGETGTITADAKVTVEARRPPDAAAARSRKPSNNSTPE